MDSITRKQAINIIRFNEWDIEEYLSLTSEDGLWKITGGIWEEDYIVFRYKDIKVGYFEFPKKGFFFRSIDSTDELYVTFHAAYTLAEESLNGGTQEAKIKAVKEISKLYDV